VITEPVVLHHGREEGGGSWERGAADCFNSLLGGRRQCLSDEGPLRVSVGLPVVLKFSSEFQFQRGVFRGQSCVGTEQVSELESGIGEQAFAAQSAIVFVANPLHDLGALFAERRFHFLDLHNHVLNFGILLCQN